VVKVRGNAGERHSWAPKNCWRAFPGPTQPLMVQAGWEGPLQLTVGPKIFSQFLGPKFMLSPLGLILQVMACLHCRMVRLHTQSDVSRIARVVSHRLPWAIRKMWECRCADLQIFEGVRVKIIDLGLSRVRVRVKVRVSVGFMVSYHHFKVHKIRRSAHPLLPVAPSLQFSSSGVSSYGRPVY